MIRRLSSSMLAGTLAIAGVLALLLVSPGKAQNTELAVFSGIAKGEWLIRFRDGSPSRSVCVRSGQELIQLKHGDTGCSHVVVANDQLEATVQYSCPGNGYGRTTIRRETRALLQLSSQGIADKRPFQIYGEARRQGNCR